MTSFLDMTQEYRRMYVARQMGLSVDHPDSWPLETIDRIIKRAEGAADCSARDDVRSWLNRR